MLTVLCASSNIKSPEGTTVILKTHIPGVVSLPLVFVVLTLAAAQQPT